MSRTPRDRPLPETQQPRVNDSATQRAFELLFVPLREVVRFLQPYVQREKWSDLTFQPTWGHTGSPYELGAYRKDPWGVVHLEGIVSRSAGALTPIFVLPQGYRPLKSHVFGLWTTAGFSSVVIDSTGLVTYNGAAGGLSLCLSGIHFDTRAS